MSTSVVDHKLPLPGEGESVIEYILQQLKALTPEQIAEAEPEEEAKEEGDVECGVLSDHGRRLFTLRRLLAHQLEATILECKKLRRGEEKDALHLKVLNTHRLMESVRELQWLQVYSEAKVYQAQIQSPGHETTAIRSGWMIVIFNDKEQSPMERIIGAMFSHG